MPDKPEGPISDDDYQSTPEDRRRAQFLGVVYVILAIFLAWMLFKIWPPTPWPSTAALLANPQLAKELKDLECPMPSPSPQASIATTATNSQTNSSGSSASPSPTAKPSATSSASATPPSNPATTPTSGGGTRTGSEGGGAASSPSPSPSVSPTPLPPETLVNIPINFFWGYWCYRTSFDERLILLVIIAGMLGSFVHGATSLADFIGNNKFNKNWTWFYLLRPVIGMSLALVFYFVIRGGFLTTSGGAKDINPYGIAALAGLVGMFSKQATDKLSEVFGTLFRSKPGEGDDKRAGSLSGDGAAITVTGLAPDNVHVGTAEPLLITISGTNFVAGCKVRLNDIDLETTFGSVSKVTATIPAANFTAPGTFKVTVVNPDGKASAPVNFEVKTP